MRKTTTFNKKPLVLAVGTHSLALHRWLSAQIADSEPTL